nr:hypothetical protein [uncultured Glaciecola sp.]
MKNRRSLKTFEIDKFKVSCHPDARDAYIYSKGINTYIDVIQKRSTIQSVDLLRENQQFNPLIAIEAAKQELQYFSGWRWYEKCLAAEVNEVEVIVYEDFENLNLRKVSWQYLLSEHLYGMQRGSSLLQLVNLIKAIPKHLKTELLASNNARSAITVVQNITGETREAVRWSVNNAPATNKESIAILDELLKGK